MATTKGNSPDATFTPLVMRDEANPVGDPLTFQQDNRRKMERIEKWATRNILIFNLCENQGTIMGYFIQHSLKKKKMIRWRKFYYLGLLEWLTGNLWCEMPRCWKQIIQIVLWAVSYLSDVVKVYSLFHDRFFPFSSIPSYYIMLKLHTDVMPFLNHEW